MDCRESEQMMMADVDGELDAPTVACLRAHLATCAACRTAHAALSDLHAEIRQHATVHVAPSHLRHRIIASLPRKPARRKFAAWPWAWINFAAAAAFSAAFATMLMLRLSAPSPADQLEQEIVSSHFRSLMADHLTDVASSDQHTVKPWFTGKLDFSPPVFDLAQQGFPLIGGRLDYLAGRTVAALAYHRHKHVVNLFVWPEKPGTVASAAFRMSARQGYQLASWTEGGFRYEAVSDTNAQELTEFRRLLESQLRKASYGVE